MSGIAPPKPRKIFAGSGFTLIEMSIVLAIIGLIVGGILVGRDLIRSAGVRAQVTQIEKFNQAANAFYGKYGYLPGDIPANPAAQFGFASRGSYAGEGDGNGILEGVSANAASSNNGLLQATGETTMFWVDLSAVNMIEGTFNTASANNPPAYCIQPTFINGCTGRTASYLPAAKIGNGNFVYAYSLGSYAGSVYTSSAKNYFGISANNSMDNTGAMNSVPAMTVQQAYGIDKKMDDGFPTSGNVIATYVTDPNYVTWPGVNTILGANPGTVAIAGTSTTCFDNGGGSGPQQYSVEQNGGANVNCALSIRMQAGD